MASLSESCIAELSNVHRLVIVEGIMGSGKSTTMRFIVNHLNEAGRPAVHIHERTCIRCARQTNSNIGLNRGGMQRQRISRTVRWRDRPLSSSTRNQMLRFRYWTDNFFTET
jgi:hypothetical protein